MSPDLCQALHIHIVCARALPPTMSCRHVTFDSLDTFERFSRGHCYYKTTTDTHFASHVQHSVTLFTKAEHQVNTVQFFVSSPPPSPLEPHSWGVLTLLQQRKSFIPFERFFNQLLQFELCGVKKKKCVQGDFTAGCSSVAAPSVLHKTQRAIT